MKIRLPLKSIKSRMITYYSIIFLLFFGLLGLVCYLSFSDILYKEILNFTGEIVDEANLNIDSYFNHLEVTMEVSAGSDEIMQALKKYSAGSKDYETMLNGTWEIDSALGDLLKFNPYIKDIIIIDNNGKVIDNAGTGGSIKLGYNFLEQDWFPKDMGPLFKIKFIGLHSQDYYINPPDSNINENIISAVIPIIDVSAAKKATYGVMLCNMDANNIQQITKEINLEKDGFFLIMDNNRKIVYKPENFIADNSFIDELSTKISGDNGYFLQTDYGKKYTIVYNTSQITGWKIIAMIPVKDITGHLNGIRINVVLLAVISIFLVFIASIIISGKVTGPITRLMNLMGKIEKGDFNIKLFDNSSDEIEKLSSRIDLMIERINILNRDIYSYQIKNKEAEVKALQSQINPHFLYNTLQSIKTAAVLNRSGEISKMVTLIGNMLRYAVYNPKEMVKIEDELRHVEEYIEIQRYRYPDQFNYILNCEDDLKSGKILKLVLQPLVENAFIHGFQSGSKGTIRINIDRVSEGIRLQVRDNGNGIDAGVVKRIVEYLENHEQKDESSSIGLKNVHERIRLKFGMPYGLSIHSDEGSGTCVEILIPLIFG